MSRCSRAKPRKAASARRSPSRPSVAPRKRGADIVADLRRHVAHQRLEQRLLGIEVGVESAERDARALGDADDRTVGKSALTEFLARRIEDLAHRALAPRGPRRLGRAGCAELRSFPRPSAPSGPPTARPNISKLKHGSSFSMDDSDCGRNRASKGGENHNARHSCTRRFARHSCRRGAFRHSAAFAQENPNAARQRRATRRLRRRPPPEATRRSSSRRGGAMSCCSTCRSRSALIRASSSTARAL